MANPQIEHGYIRVANELWDEIIRRDFSKRQKDILFFIWRLSYGCQKKQAYIPRMKHFQLCGVSETKIKEELEHLERCRVLIWDRENKAFEINKDYENWYVSLVKAWNEDSFNELLALNISQKTSQKGKENFPKRETDIPEKGRMDFPKREDRDASNPCGSKDEEVSKDIIKYNIKNNNLLVVVEDKPNPFVFWETNGFGTISSFLTENINYWLDGNFFDEPEEVLIRAMQEADLNNAKTWKYIEGTLINWEKARLRSVRDIEAHIAAYKAKKTGGGNRARNRESPPGDFDKSEYFSL